MFDTLKDFDQRNNVAFVSYYQCFNAMKKASYAAHIMATNCTEDFKKTLERKNLEAERMSEYTEELQQQPSEAVESEIDEEFLKFYEESLKYKKDKSRMSYLNRCLTRFE